MPEFVSEELEIKRAGGGRSAWDDAAFAEYVKKHVNSKGTYHWTLDEILQFYNGGMKEEYQYTYAARKLLKVCESLGIEADVSAAKKQGKVILAVKKLPK